ncbi:MAG: MMPL family transporter [Bacteroidia bacterium]|nr:MMPL family transporter [Bacteroidia bacterium]MDW8235053.1 MMPL family transporter [Bacteroidia bacterium]
MSSWTKLLLQGRYVWLGLAFVGSLYMAEQARHVQILQDFVKVIPQDDPDYLAYQRFQKEFGEDAATLFIGITVPSASPAAFWRSLQHLCDTLKTFPGLKNVLGVPTAPQLIWDKEQFRTTTLSLPTDSAQWALLRQYHPLYQGILWEKNGSSTILILTLDSAALHSAQKHLLIQQVEGLCQNWANTQGVEVHFSGVPYLRHYISEIILHELWIFVGLSLLLTVLALLAYFRSWYAAIFPVILLGLASLWTVGTMGIYGYRMSLLTALLPPVIIILGIPPAIYMLSEYHRLYVAKGNKVAAIREMLSQLGLVTFMIHANTALGFLTLYLTNVVPLQEFGLVAFWGTIATYFLTILLVPSLFMILPEPQEKNLRHLYHPGISKAVRWIGHIVEQRRPWIYALTGIGLLVAVGGILRLRAVSYMADDLPQGGKVIRDQRFFEERYGGMLPFEIVLETRQPRGLRKPGLMRALSALQDSLSRYPELSRSLSLSDLIKGARQAFWGGSPSAYAPPQPEELPTLLRSLRTASAGLLPMGSLVDTAFQRTRISALIRDIGSADMPALLQRIHEDIQATFGEEAQNVRITGTTVIFLKAIDYLIDNLIWSLIATFLLVAVQMFLLYGSFRIMLISMGVNLLPLLFVAGLMGYISMPIKPSTALIYEIAFGIIVDSAIHFLSSYQWFYRKHPLPVRAAVVSIHHTGALIAYTSFVLLMGFAIFIFSSFGGTKALGILTSLSLLIGLFSNLFLLPALLITFRQSSEGTVRKAWRHLRKRKAAGKL